MVELTTVDLAAAASAIGMAMLLAVMLAGGLVVLALQWIASVYRSNSHL